MDTMSAKTTLKTVERAVLHWFLILGVDYKSSVLRLRGASSIQLIVKGVKMYFSF